ncbi:NADH-quinone oxidoreductase subunit NuoG [Candidatus Zinderia endosymbiont of Aphrophora alni]|uniref:NADH-quinone oxidoreductase subunit NuoG n=1 Tax=Candidatus Zinderia endosymbiont of Aphrophora alni TaxID=3077951 RepID=UPI0030CF5FD6
MINIKINKKKFFIKKKNTILNIAKKNGIYIPYFCYHKKLSISANCRMCLIEIKNSIKLLPACATEISDGMIIKTNSKKVIEARKNILDFFLINHPLDCPICDKGGECKLQDFSMKYGNFFSKDYKNKRVFLKKNVGPLISMNEMNRCINCTRCIRFSEEIAGNSEIGIINKGEKSEIITFYGKKINSELSGNMIDICPVGAITSKPFRFKARPWELKNKKSISPFDNSGSNLTIQIKDNKILRILPYENKNINECWISNKERFFYDGLYNNRNLLPKIKINKKWEVVKLSEALKYIKNKIIEIQKKYNSNSIATICNTSSTLEELFLIKKITKKINSPNIDFRLRQTDFNLNNKIIPWLGINIKDIPNINGAFIIGSFLKKDHPIISLKIRQSIKNGSKINILNANYNDNSILINNKIIIQPSLWVKILYEILVYILKKKKKKIPEFITNIKISQKSKNIANDLLFLKNTIILLGNLVTQHPEYSQIHIISQTISEETNSKLGYLTEANNIISGYITKVFSKNKNINSKTLFKNLYKSYILYNVEPEFDCYNPILTKKALKKSKFTVVISPFIHNMKYAHVILPITPFTENSGTFINVEGIPQSFKRSIKPLNNIISGWELLCKLGKIFKIPNLNYKSSLEIKEKIFTNKNEIINKLNNYCKLKFKPIKKYNKLLLERISDIPIYLSNSILRRSKILSKTQDSQEPKILISKKLSKKLSISNYNIIYIKQKKGYAILEAYIDKNLPENVIQISAAHKKTSNLGKMIGNIKIKKHYINNN